MIQYSGKQNTKMVSYVRGDVTGDNIYDNVYLIGRISQDSPFIQDITLVIQDGSTEKFYRIPLKYNAGYNPTLFLGDFTNDGIKDILVSIPSGGSGGITFYYIYSFKEHVADLLFDFEQYNKDYQYEVIYEDNYKVRGISKANNLSYMIDITNKDEQYLNEIYTKRGTLKNPINGFVNPLSGLYPIDFDLDNTYELLAYQKIAGRYNADSLGYFLNTLKWNNNMFRLDNQNVAIWGETS